MTLRDYLRDKIAVYAIRLVALMIVVLFLYVFKTDFQAIGTIVFIAVAVEIVVTVYDFIKRKGFYDSFENSLQGLDKKYLVTEMVKTPEFLDGKIFYDSLFECNKSMAEQVAEYRRQNREFREYIEIWVHEVKIPIATMRLMCRNNPDSDERMVSQLKRVDDDIENVLFYARSEDAGKDFIIKEIPLKKVFSNVALKNKDALLEQNVSLETENLNACVMTDGKWLEYILGQLMSNSMKYAANDRALSIRVSAEVEGKKTILHFEDNGKGIAAEDIPYIFEKSFTGTNGHEESKATGMGLYIVKNMCNCLGIKIDCESRRDEYTRFNLTFL
ncbi:MAG: sensor histidine kinase [Lachnospiraceae bacterium]|nr:sensor histidine kinase [Lachnospiraceae bacterium]